MRGKTKYYFRKPKGEIVKDILTWIALGGVVTIAVSSPYFVRNLLKAWPQGRRYKQKSSETAFQRLRKEGAITVVKKRHQYEISLTEKGRKKAGWLQINSLAISKPNKWDGKWRLLIFDVRQAQRWKRDVLRSFLRRLEFVPLQKSVWIHPYDCRAELDLLKEFLGLTPKEIKLLVVDKVVDDEERLRKKFHLFLG